jgi:hypothetical protein
MLAGLGKLQLASWFPSAAIFLAFFALPLFLLDLTLERRGEEYIFQRSPQFSRIAAGLVLAGLLVAFSANSNAAFIYFQF